ncbi:MAG: hypothetical protein PHD76_03705 [Methylacidiphilales bacterium]|nr:hypothetical protein [Candidatus Methylacidiphilales bacterium]
MNHIHHLITMLLLPEYQHILVNHVPLTGLGVAVIVLAVGVVFRARSVVLTGLLVVALTTGSIALVTYTGDRAADRVQSMTDKDGEAWLHRHEALADRWSKLYYATAALALIALIVTLAAPKIQTFAGFLVLVLAVASLGAGFYIAEAGGQIRHREFRVAPPPPTPAESDHAV